ncbi:MAG: beta-ketoacyl-[acyl-carrier-protein] synthase II, partial [Dehalococcoidia bacterium]|nr:beta-ketoacyl-[acyl-carrier-protein] synthase II [Dehalococcoidia bacterium]
LGHVIGGAGAIEAAICIMTIQSGLIPPTTNLANPDPECDLDYVPNQARPKEVRTVMSSSFGFGGHNSVLVLRRWEDAA